jgi:signal transduction histidine kinase
MSLRYKILAAVIGINVVILFATFAAVFLETSGRWREYRRFREAVLRDARDWSLTTWGRRVSGAQEWEAPLIDLVVLHRPRPEGLQVLGGTRQDLGVAEGLIRARVREAMNAKEIVFHLEDGVVVIPEPDEILRLQDRLPVEEEAEAAPGPPEALYVQVVFPEFRNPMQGVKLIYVAMVAGTVLLMVVTFVLVSRLVLVPIDRLVNAANRIAGGDYSEPVPSTRREDEIETLIEAFNAMMVEVKSYRQHLEERVQEATRQVKLAEKSLTIAQRLAATGKLASGIAHEVNNPLGGMINAARRLRGGELPPEKQEQYLEIIEDGLTRVRDTIQKILRFTPHRVKPQPVELRMVVDRSLALVAHRAEKAGAEIRVDVPERGLVVFGDHFELQQVVLNLLLNAVDALDGTDRPGRVELVGEASDGEIRLLVSDNGRGMSEDGVASAFDLFYTTKDVGSGTGLGLSIVHNVVTNHGGRIEVQSDLDRGTTFTVHLPAVPSAEDES